MPLWLHILVSFCSVIHLWQACSVWLMKRGLQVITSSNLLLCLARTCVYFWQFALTCDHFDLSVAQICLQVSTSFSPFGHQTQVHVVATQCKWSYAVTSMTVREDQSKLHVFVKLTCNSAWSLFGLPIWPGLNNCWGEQSHALWECIRDGKRAIIRVAGHIINSIFVLGHCLFIT